MSLRHQTLFAIGFVLLAKSALAFQDGKDTLSSQAIFQEAKHYQRSAVYDSALYLYDLLIKRSEASQDWKGVVLAYNGIGGIKIDQGRFEEAEKLLQKSLQLSDLRLDGAPRYKGEASSILAYLYSITKNFPGALRVYQQALAYYTEAFGENHVDIANTYGGMAAVYLEMDDATQEAKSSLQKAISILKNLGLERGIEMARSFHEMGGTFKKMEVFDSSLYYYEKSLAIKRNVLRENHPEFSVSYYQLASTSLDFGDLDGAISYYQQALDVDIANFGTEHPWVGEDYVSLANCYNIQGAYQKSIRYANRALQILKASYGEEAQEVARTLNVLGYASLKSEQLDEAESYFKEAASYSKKLVDQYSSFRALVIHVEALNFLGDLYSIKEEHEAAVGYHQQALNVLNRWKEPQNYYLARTYYQLGIAYFLQESLAEAEQSFAHSRRLYEEIYSPGHPELSDLLRWQGELKLKMGLEEEALALFRDAALRFYAGSSFSKDSFPPLRQISSFTPVLIQSLSSQVKARQQQYEKSGDLLLLKKAYATVDYTRQVLDSMRISSIARGSERSPLQEHLSVFEAGLEVIYQIYQEENDPAWMNEALRMMESSKSLQLLAALRESEARHFTGVPDSVLQLEKELMIKLSFAESKARQEEDPKRWQEKAFFLRQSYDSLRKHLATRHPDYHRLRYQTESISIHALQQSLQEDEMLLEYLMGDSALYLLAVDRRQTELHQLPLTDSFSTQLSLLRDALAYKRPLEDFRAPAYALYHHLLKPVAELPRNKRLIIIPDGMLSYLPFEVLLMEEASEGNSFKNLSYLTRTHQLNYQYSATLMQVQTKKTNKAEQMNYLAFAPDFNQPLQLMAAAEMNEPLLEDTVRGQLAELKGTRREVQEISRWMQGKYFDGQEASEDNFKQMASQYEVLHLATHAIVDDQYPMNSRLLFTPSADSLEDGSLYAWELYELDLNASMVVLSACNTGFGKIQRGEGVMSLGRAFAYAGCPSVVMSLWPAQDQATADLMGYFYEAVAGGMKKDEAMQQARLRYLKEADDLLSHPFYWAGFVVQGSNQPLTSGFTLAQLLPYSAFILLLIPIFVLRRKKIFRRG
ncbi:MAG: CHAT domain-containing protein [Cyclobacteriaceae bacterium]